MLDPIKTASASVKNALEHGATITIAVRWQAEAKTWLIVGTLHTTRRNEVRTLKVDHTGAPDVDDLVRLLGAIRLECESWLW